MEAVSVTIAEGVEIVRREKADDADDANALKTRTLQAAKRLSASPFRRRARFELPELIQAVLCKCSTKPWVFSNRLYVFGEDGEHRRQARL